jgi:ribosomal protein S18 acetylase RimI-like enzyme
MGRPPDLRRGGSLVTAVAITAATVEDLDAAAGRFGAYLAFYDVERDPDDAREFLRARLQSGESLVLLARVDGGPPAGFAQVYFTFSSLSLGSVWTFNDLYVDASARGSGLGRALVREVLRRAAAAGALRVQGETAVDNLAAQALYAAEAFEVEHGFLQLSRACV